MFRRRPWPKLIQTRLAPTGLDTTIRTMPSAEAFALVNQPPQKRPDIYVAGIGGDASHPRHRRPD